MSYPFTFGIALGEDDTGLTLRGQLVDTVGANVGATFTAGFVEVGTGSYLLNHATIPDDHRGGVVIMDDADGSILGFGVINPEAGEYTDVAVSSRAPAAEYDTQLDANMSTRAPAGEYDTELDATMSSRAIPGDEMDLVDAPNGTALTAIGTAVWATTVRTLSTYGTLVADITTAVWAAGARTLTSFGTLVADTAAAVWDALILDHITIPFEAPYTKMGHFLYYAYTRLDNWLSVVEDNIRGEDDDDLTGISDEIAALNDPTAATIADAVWDEDTADHVTAGSFGAWVSGLLASIWAYATRTLTAWLDGAKVCTITALDGASNPVGACPYVLKNSGGQTLQAGTTHTTTGVFVANLDEADDYSVTLGTLAGYNFANPYDVDVAADAAQAFTLTATKISGPVAPTSPTLCRCYAYMRYIESGAVVGEDDGSLDITEVVDRPAGTNLVYSPGTSPALTDANGYVYIDLVRGAIVKVKAIVPNSVQSIQTIRVPDAATYDVGQVLQP